MTKLQENFYPITKKRIYSNFTAFCSYFLLLKALIVLKEMRIFLRDWFISKIISIRILSLINWYGCCCIDYSFLMYRDEIQLQNLKNILGMCSTLWHPMDESALDVRPTFPSELKHYYLTLAWVWKVSYFNPP